jgi:hypothetical protein
VVATAGGDTESRRTEAAATAPELADEVVLHYVPALGGR